MKARTIAIAGLLMLVGCLGAQRNGMYGAFKITTEPRGAIVTLVDSDQYLGTTPSQTFPIVMDRYDTDSNGIPGRVFNIRISMDGYKPIQREIFVPYNKNSHREAMRRPTIFNFKLTRKRNYHSYNRYYAPCPPPPSPWIFWVGFAPRRPFAWNEYQPPHHDHGGHYGHGEGYHPGSGGGNGGHNPPPDDGQNPPPGGGHGHGPRP